MSVFQGKYFAYVNSRNRISGTNGNFTYDLAIPTDRKFNRVSLVDIIIPKSYYLVDTDRETFILREPSQVDVQITIPSGCYILAAWVATIQGLLNSSSLSGWTYTITNPLTSSLVSANTGKLIYTVSGNSGQQPSLIMDSEISEAFGFDEGSTNLFVANSLTSTDVIKLQSEDRLLLTSNVCVGSGGTDIGILQAINSQGSPDYSTIVYQNPQVDANSKVFSSAGGSTYTFVLTDEDGHPLFLNGLNINFTLLFYYENPIYEKIKAFLHILIEEKEQEQEEEPIEAPNNLVQAQPLSTEQQAILQQENRNELLVPEEPNPQAESQQNLVEVPELSLAQDSLPKDQDDNLI